MRATRSSHRLVPRCFRLIALLLLAGLLPMTAQSPDDNGIHVGRPKMYDSRALTLMLDSLAESMRAPGFIDTKALASALGNLQGFTNQDFSQSLMLNGAVGPNAASVFAGAAGAGATPSTTAATSTAPTVSITLTPTATSSSGTTAATTPAASTPSPTLGPQPPALPTLQTAPAFTPNFGMNSADLLSDQVNLTYQFYNISMMVQRAVSDRVYKGNSRLQAVIGFDVDIEPSVNAKDAVAVVDVVVTMKNCNGLPNCDTADKMSLVAIMPEEGSHNAATLNQRADAFGGAIASAVFSVGYATQKRSQVFYLYRDMDTVSFQRPDPDGKSVNFGWQFRPVLGRHSVSPGMRHMLAVLALPANDDVAKRGEDASATPNLKVDVRTSWMRYDQGSQLTGGKPSFWASLFKTERHPPDGKPIVFADVAVPRTATTQLDLGPEVSKVTWVQGDASSGVAIVTGKNFFPGTTVRFGGKSYATPADGLVIKSDQQLEVALPLGAAVTEGVLSGRYGKAKPLQSADPFLPAGFDLRGLKFLPSGNDMYQVQATLAFYDDQHKPKTITIDDLQTRANRPVVSVNGIPSSAPSFFEQADDCSVYVTTFVPGSFVKAGPVTITVTFPFEGPAWSASLPHYDATLKVARIGGKDRTRLLISATDPTMWLCGYHLENPNSTHRTQDWELELDGKRIFQVLKDDAVIPPEGGLKCAQKSPPMLSLDMETKDLKQFHHFALVNKQANYPLLIGNVPPPEPPPPGPKLDKDQKVTIPQNVAKTVTYKGKNLDQVKKVLFDKESLTFKCNDEGTEISIRLTRTVTAKPGVDNELDLISEDNDPVHAAFTVTPTPAQKAGK